MPTGFWAWVPLEGMETVKRSLLRENNGSMQFFDTKEVSSRSPRELKFVCYIFRLEDLANQLNDELMWCLMVFQHDCMASTFPKVK